ncbi:GH25 family lysozyme [Schleiferilactobacillus perolens]|uniref:GH25 family lysozyme n=1 Tax=Schleiferilactobacillus perolens TaxID=100468 RepID=UPI0039ED8217
MTLNGIDIASYQAGIDLGAVPGDFAIVKATQGTGYTNPDFARQVAQTLSSGKLLGFYHFLEVGNIQSQADYYLSKVGPYVGKGILVLDYERYQDVSGSHLPTVDEAKQWLDYIKSKTGVAPLIYMGLADENRLDWSSVAKSYGLWVAQYNNNNPVYGYQPRDIFGSVKHWPFTAIFQYTSIGQLSGWGSNLDLNIFYGDRSAWEKYAKGNGSYVSIAPSPTPSKPTPAPAPANSWKDSLGVTWYFEKATWVTNSPVKLRWGATTSSSVITILSAGSEIKYDAKAVSDGYIWLRQPRSDGYGYIAAGVAGSGGRNVDPYGHVK